ncbi:Ent-copalyl diphosphate synthase chloroplastic [Bienertia sinuspersici]
MAERDCLSLISKLKKGVKLNSAVGFIVSDILSLASYFELCSFSYVRREGNSLAHNVAKRSVNLNHEVVWLENFPDFATILQARI